MIDLKIRCIPFVVTNLCYHSLSGVGVFDCNRVSYVIKISLPVTDFKFAALVFT